MAILNTVVERHLGPADALANRYWHNGQDREDLVQVARAGLVEAARRFDPNLGDFIAFAVPTITGVIKRHFRDHGWMVRPPRQTQELVIAVRQNWSAIAQEVKGEPTSADLAVRAGVPADSIRAALVASDGYRPASLTHSECVLPSMSAQEEFDRCEASTIVLATMRQLAPGEQRLVRMRYFERLSQQEIAVRTGTNQMSVSRQLTRLLTKMRELVGSLEAA
ncbi:MAG: sigma-70 family RNA polymerase sigma factor [Actinomycetes bacterium]